jgi:uncharacterized repeat protein (TIGR02543 family)
MLFKDNSQIGYLRSQMFSALSLTSFLLSFFSRFFSKFSAIALFVVFIVNTGWGQTPNGTLDFGTTANGTTATTGNTGFGGVRVGTAGGGFTIQNPGQSIGADGELRGIAPTSGSINSVGITSTEYGTAATTFTISFELHLSGGSSGTWYFFAGNGASFGSAQSASFTSAQVFTGIRWVYGASSAITTNNRVGTNWNATGLSTPFAQSTSYYVTIIGNNSSSTVNYGASNAYSVAAYKYDLWINGSLAGNDLGKGELTNSTSINAFRFYGESSTSNVATIALDNIRWYNTCTLPPTHLALVSVPTTGAVGSNLTSFTTEARSGSSTGPVSNSFTGAITVAKVSGSGSISGTTAPNATAGVSTYSNIQFSSADTYTINATAAAPIVTAATSGNIVYSAASSYTVTFNGNGSTGGSMSDQSASTSTVLTSNAFTRTGYTFAGWSTSAGGAVVYADGASYPFTSSTTLYAQWTLATTPTITATGTLSAVNTTYGTASASPTSFSVSGSALTNDIIISAPSGYEISTSLASGYATSLTLSQGGGAVSSTTIYVRLAATTAVGSYSGNISLTSTGATTQNVATVSSAVSTKALTITGLSASNKVYDATTTASLSGTAVYSGLVNSESFSVSGTPSATYATETVGTGKAVTVTGYTAPSANYTVTQPTGLTATITAKTITVTSAAASNKTYDGTTTATISGTLSGVIAGDVVTLTGTGTFASANVGTGIVVTSTSTLAGADNANYTLTQPTGLSANITQASQTIVFGALPTKTTADAAFACGATSATSGTNALTYSSSNTLVATINASGTITIVGEGTTSITVSQAGSANYSAAADVAQTLTVTQGPCGTETFTSSNATASYTSSSFTGDNGVTWTYTQSQDNSSYQINGASLLLRRLSDNSKVVSGSVSGGIGNFTCKLLKGYTGAGNRQVALYINNIFQANSTAWDNTSVQTFTVNDINIAGSVVIEIRNITANQVVVDDISWTCYTPSSVPQAVSSSAATSVVNTTAILNGNLTTVGVAPNTTEKGFVYSQTSTNSTPEVGGTGVTKTSVAGISTGAYTLSLAGLSTSTGYSFRAYAYNGTNYTYGSVLTFTTLTVATKLGFGTTPPAVGSISTNLTTFTVQALRSDNTLDTEFSGSITVAKASGPGNIAGTLTATASSGVATFSSVQFDALGDYTIIASSGALTTVTSSTSSILAYAVGDYRTKQNGNWGTSSTWEKWDGSAWSSSSNVPNSSTANVFVLHTVDVNGSGTPPWDVNNLTVQLGGKLWCNSFSGNNDYIQVYGDILCDGTIGSTAGDDISFDIAGGNDCNISGTGSFTASRLRKDSDINTGQNSNVTIDMDVRLTWSSASGTVLYNNSGASSDFNVTINTGKNLRCSGPGSIACNVSIDGVDGAGSGNRGGTYTVYGTLDIDGALISMNDNTFNTKSTNVIVENGGTLKCRYINTGASTNSNVLRVKNTGKLTIFGSVDTITATLNDVTWYGYSATNNTWDFQSGSTIEYSGATQQRVNGITTCSNFTVSGGGLKKLGNDFTVAGMLTLTNGRIQTDAYKLIHTSTSSADLTHTTGSSSFIFGTYRRYIASNSSTYELPVGLSSATSGYRRADIINNNLSGVTYIDASVRSITETANNIDSRLSTTQIGSSLTDVLGASVWSLVPNTQPSGGTYGVNLYVANTGLSSSDDNTFCAVKRNDNSTDYADWNTFYASTTIPSSGAPGRMYDSGNGYAQRLGYTSFSEHALGKTPANQPLPVELNMFDAFCQEKGKTTIKWSTATEHNTAYFQLDRSNNGLEWQALGSIGAAVNSDEEIQYNFEDRNNGGLLYYRLHQVDINGGEQMYGPVSVNCENNVYEINTFPNPSSDNFNVSIFSESDLVSCNLQVLDVKGMVVYVSTKSLNRGSNEYEIMCEKWLPGVYFIEVIFEDGNMYRKKHVVM